MTAGVWMVCTLMALSACSSVELEPTNPTGVDLSGTWLVNFTASDDASELQERRNPQLRKRRLSETTVRREAMRVADGSGMAFVAHDFQVLQADKMEIELNRDSMGIRYFPGVYRDVTWGERQRGLWEVYAGWEERRLIIISEAKDLKVVETFDRSRPNQLTVHVAIEADGDEEQITRVFTRR